MEGYCLTTTARQDIRDIVLYIAVDNSAAADRVSDAIFDTFSLLVTQPHMGKRSDQFDRPSVRYTTIKKFSSYLIFYELLSSGTISILRVVHGARDLIMLLNK